MATITEHSIQDGDVNVVKSEDDFLRLEFETEDSYSIYKCMA